MAFWNFSALERTAPATTGAVWQRLAPAPTWLALAVVIYLGAQLGLLLTLGPAGASPFWPPAGLALFALLKGGLRLWPGLLLGNILVYWSLGYPAPAMVGAALVGVVEALVGYVLVRRYTGLTGEVWRSRDILWFVVLAVGVSTLVGTGLAVGLMVVLDRIPTEELGLMGGTWWLGDAAGVLVLTPLLLLWLSPSRPRYRGRHRLEAVLLVAATTLITGLIFGDILPSWNYNYPLAFLSLPLLLWAALRFGLPLTSVCNALVALLAILGTLQGYGPFGGLSPVESLVIVQLFMMLTGLTGLGMAALSEDRNRIQQALQRARHHLENQVEDRTRHLRQEMEARREAEALHARLASVLEITPSCVGFATPDRRVLYANPSLARLVGADQEAIKGKPVSHYYPDWAYRMVTEQGIPAAIHQGCWQGEAALLDAKGREVPVSMVIHAHYRDDGQVDFLSTIMRNITHRKQTEARLQGLVQQLERQRRVLDQVLSNATDCFYLHDLEGRYRFANAVALRVAGLTWPQMEGRTPRELGYPETVVRSFEQDLARLRETRQPVTNKIDVMMPYGECHLETVLSPVFDADGGIDSVVSTVRDVTERHVYEAKLRHQAAHDALTGLPNRGELEVRLQAALERAEAEGLRVAVLFMDLVRFKAINDSLGHIAGDELLKAVAQRLRRYLRDDDIVARPGADEFVVAMPDLGDSLSEEHIANKIMRVFQDPFLLQGRPIHLGARIGISLFPRDGDDVQTLLRNADIALHEIKRGTSNVRWFASGMLRHAEQRLRLENDLRHALERDELLLHYQPQVSLGSGRVVGVEALLRWRHPVLGMVSPMDFIPIAEESGLINPIGEWVLHTACTQARDWVRAGLGHLRMGVNLSTRQFLQRDLPAQVQAVLRDTGLEPPWLELEITESMLMQDVDGAVNMLQTLKAMGVELAIDDFGTGYSSLNYLKRFPVDRLKIDRSFIRDITTNPSDAAIAQAVIGLARNLNLKVIAEGVEEQAHVDFLRRRGCDEVQGYLLGKPLPAEATTELLRQARSLMSDPTMGTPSARPTVLLVDDDAALLELLGGGLRQWGYEVLSADNAQLAFDRLARHPVGVVIADQVMPGMSGMELLTHIRALYPETVCIMLSGQSNRADLIDALNSGVVYRFLEKPVALEALRDLLAGLFQTRFAGGGVAESEGFSCPVPPSPCRRRQAASPGVPPAAEK